jgi:hypothetical protein
VGDTPEKQLAGFRQQEKDMRIDTDAPDSHARRPHPIDSLISPALRSRLADLDPLLNLDRAARLVTVQRAGRRSAA